MCSRMDLFVRGEPTVLVLLQIKNSRMHGLTLLEGGPESSMQPVLEVELTSPGDDMSKKVAVEGRVLFEQGFEVEGPLGGDQLVQAHLVGGDGRPLLLHVAMVWVRAYVTDALENHCVTLVKFLPA
jgi:hypothetical protein